eukprot:7555882-Heterocapsa_arctica.AAC.1
MLKPWCTILRYTILYKDLVTEIHRRRGESVANWTSFRRCPPLGEGLRPLRDGAAGEAGLASLAPKRVELNG